MVPSFSFLGFLLPLLVFSLSQTSFTDATDGFTVDLIHRDSIESPLNKPSDSHIDRLRASIRRSNSRSNTLNHQAVLTKAEKSRQAFESGIVSAGYEYLISIKVGTPSRNILAIADTGSDIIWTNCKPCLKCYKQDTPLFDPKKSSSYHGLNCNSDSCRLLQFAKSNCTKKSDKCKYSMKYGDGSLVGGLLATESFYFNTSKGEQKTVRHVTFGCSFMSNGTFNSKMAGIVGLGGGPLSLVSQLGPVIDHKFSYCLTHYTEKKVTSKLNFGSNAIVTGPNVQSTSLMRGPLFPPTFYIAQLSGVKVGEMELKIKNNAIIIDSGTTLTYLNREIVQAVTQEITKELHLPHVKDPDFDLCYNITGNNQLTIDQFPDVVLALGSATVRLGPKNTFVLVDEGKVCLTIVAGETQLLGNIAQQDFHIGYDLGEGKVYFSETDCAKF